MAFDSNKFAQVRTRLSKFGWKIVYDWSFSLGSLIAFYLVLSLLPLMLSIFSISIIIFGHDTVLLQILRDRFVNAFPQQGLSDIADALIASLEQQAWFIFMVSFIVAIFGGSRLIIGIDDALTIIYRVRERTILNQNIHAIKMLLVFIIFFPMIIITTSITALLHEYEVWYSFLSKLSSGILAFAVFNLIFYYVPNKDMYFKNTWCGSLLATIGLLILFLVFPVYVHNFMTNYVGNLGFIIVVLLLFYILGLIFVIGAQINAYFFEDIQPLPAGLGDCLSLHINHESIPLVSADVDSQPNSSTPTLIEGLDPYKRIS